jgi:integrase/recombinase XerD
MTPRHKMSVSWTQDDIPSKLKRFHRYLKDQGIRPSTLESYIDRAKKYLEFCEPNDPTPELANQFRSQLIEHSLSASSINNYCFAIQNYHKMSGQPVKLLTIRRSNMIPYFFEPKEVIKIFNGISNIKHLAMFKTAFYACLRASEVCNLDLEDINLDKLTLLVRNGKGGKTALCYLSEDAADTLRDYLAVRPDIEIDGAHPLFYTDYGARFNRKDVYRLVIYYKNKAQISHPGGAHVLFRHTPASLMIANGCDLLTIKEVMRHNDVQTTMRYLHLQDGLKRQKYDRFLQI